MNGDKSNITGIVSINSWDGGAPRGIKYTKSGSYLINGAGANHTAIEISGPHPYVLPSPEICTYIDYYTCAGPADDENYHHYPSYMINCLIIEENQKGISHQFRLRIIISMLCDYFTIFCDDQYGFTDFKKQFTFAAVYDIFSFEVSKYKLPDGLLTLIESEIDRYYPGKKFIPHDIIMNTRISGSLPYNEDPRISTGDMAFSIYDLLFYYHITGDHRVLE